MEFLTTFASVLAGEYEEKLTCTSRNTSLGVSQPSAPTVTHPTKTPLEQAKEILGMG